MGKFFEDCSVPIPMRAIHRHPKGAETWRAARQRGGLPGRFKY